MSRITLLSLQLLVAVWRWRCGSFFATVPVFGKVLLPPFLLFQSGRRRQPDRRMVLHRRDLEAIS